jgi:serine phosphatase RsbU (regulator of sigma subunit)
VTGHFSTLICGRATADGAIEICNAGHCLPLIIRASGTEALPSTGLPIGIGEPGSCSVQRMDLLPGDSLVLYTDGVTETRSPGGVLYGIERLTRVLAAHAASSPALLAQACLDDLSAFQDGCGPGDDLTLMIVRRRAD